MHYVAAFVLRLASVGADVAASLWWESVRGSWAPNREFARASSDMIVAADAYEGA